MPGDDDAGFPLQVNSNAKAQTQVQMQSANATGAFAGISVVKREHEGRGAAGWVILFDPVRGLDESIRQSLCSSARLPSCSSLFLTVCVSPLPVLPALSMPVDRALIIVT
jgi:hypothetical protein